MDDDGNELELGTSEGQGSDLDIIREIKDTDLPFTTSRPNKTWPNRRYLAALIGKSARSARGAWEYTSSKCVDTGRGLGTPVLELEGEE